MDEQARLSEKGYRVVPGALRNAQKTYDIVARSWTSLREDVRRWKLDEGDLGLIGREAGVVGDYNEATDTVADKLGTCADRMQSAGEVLHEVATAYEAQDAEYYARFGWLENRLDGVAPPPD